MRPFKIRYIIMLNTITHRIINISHKPYDQKDSVQDYHDRDRIELNVVPYDRFEIEVIV